MYTDPSSDKPGVVECTAIATVKQDASGLVFLQLDEETCLYPVTYPETFTRECRIICNLSWLYGSMHCTIHWMDYLQEGSVETGVSGEGDPVDVLDDWMTCLEDGYLTIHYSTFWGDGSVPHRLRLVTGENPEDPFEVRLLHENGGDEPLEEADALVYFDLSSLPPAGIGQKLTLKWKNGSGYAAKSFLYKSRQ